jgi:hypothetical protein
VETVWTGPSSHSVAVFQHLDLRGCRRHPLRQQSLAEQGVNESAFSRIELAADDQEEELIELADRRGQRGLVGA